MPVELTGLLSHTSGGFLTPKSPIAFDLDHLINQARVQERAGFDRVLVANSATMPDPLTMASFIAGQTERLKFMIAHRPGVLAPTFAARLLATLDQVSRGRIGLHVIAGPNDKELQADGDYLTKDERYHRSLEYVQILRRLWAADAPLDFDGKYYKFTGAFSTVKPLQQPAIPIFWGGASPLAIEYAAQCADIYAMTGDSLKNTAELMQPVQAAAAKAGRTLAFQVTFIVILGDTEEAAWKLADRRLQQFLDMKAAREAAAPEPERPTNFTAKNENLSRLLKTAEEGVRVDRCLWTGMNKATQSLHGNQSTLVGTPGQVAEALMDYYDMGISNFLLRGYDPVPDAEAYGHELIPAIRKAAAARDAARAKTLATA